MTVLAEKIRRGLKNAGLLEPKTRGKKMRAMLPELNLIRGRGASVDDCVAYLRTHDLVFTSPNAFSAALYRARQAGSPPELAWSFEPAKVQAAFNSVLGSQPSNSSAMSSRAEERSGVSASGAPSLHHGVPIVRSTMYQTRTDPAHPRLKDLV